MMVCSSSSWSGLGAGRAERRGEEVLLAAVGARQQGAGVGDEAAAVDPEREAVHPTWSRTLDVLAREVVHRAVAGALEPSRALAKRHAAAEVRAPLRQGEEVPARVDQPQPALVEIGRGPRLEVGRVAERYRPAAAAAGERAQRLEGGPPQADPQQAASLLAPRRHRILRNSLRS